ncbi:MAG: helix-turn-helix domain-containing protein [Barnesiella sp.]|nr:helix-turn-helix domain-containing protein [Barnesiella sp.]
MEIFEALQEHFKNEGLSQVAIAEELGVTKSYVNALLSGRQRFGKKQAETWSEKFGISKAWLLTGEGEMLKPDNNLSDDSSDEHAGLIPFYDAETSGGYEGLVASSGIDSKLTGYIQAGGWFDSKETAAIRHIGDSMTEYPSGCILAVREVTERRLLVPGRNYVIETSEFRVTKRIQLGSTPNKLALYSSNTEKYPDGRLVHEPFEVDIEDIRKIYSVLGYIVNQSGEFRLIRP